MKINQRKIGALLSFFQMALGIIIGLIYTPFMIRILGQSEYGLYNLASSTIAMLSILNLGFNSSYIRFYSKYQHDNDHEKIKSLNGMFFLIFLGIALIALTCGLYLSKHLDIVFSTGLNSEEYQIAKVLMILLTINLAISFPMTVFTSIISAQERFVFLKLMSIGKTVFGPLVTLPLLLLGYRSIAMVIVTLAISCIVDISYIYFTLVKLKAKFCFKNFDKQMAPQLFAFTLFIAINLVVDQINLNVDKIIIGRYRGTSEVAIYSVGYLLTNYYMRLSTSISSVFIPETHRIVQKYKNDEKTQRKEITTLFSKVGRIQFLILALVAVGFIFYGKSFIVNIWAGPDFADSYYVGLLLMLPFSIELIQNTGIEVQRAQNKHWFRSIAYLCMAVINVIMSIYLCKKYGAIGSSIGTAVSYIVANGFVMNIYYYKKCNIDVIYFFKNIFQLSKGLIIPIVYALVTLKLLNIDRTFDLLFAMISFTLTYIVSMWNFGMNIDEKKLILKPLRKIIKLTQ